MPTKIRRWTYEEIALEARKYTSRRAFEKGSHSAYRASHRSGIIDDVCAHMDFQRIYWTDEMLCDEAKKFQTRGKFQKGSASAYRSAYLQGLLDKTCSHMQSGRVGGDNNMVYIWQVGSLPIYKVGVTSARLGSLRMDQVADVLGFKPNLIKLHKTKKGEARAIEAHLLEIGNQLNWEQPFNGHTEFRRWTSKHLEEALSLLCQQE